MLRAASKWRARAGVGRIEHGSSGKIDLEQTFVVERDQDHRVLGRSKLRDAAEQSEDGQGLLRGPNTRA